MEKVGGQGTQVFTEGCRLEDCDGGRTAHPFPSGVKKLVGVENTYRIRDGSYRVIFTVAASSLVIEVIRVGHRKDVYDR